MERWITIQKYCQMNRNEVIDDIVVTLKFRCNHHTIKIGDKWVSMQDFRWTTIKDVIEKLEQLKNQGE